MRQLNAILAIAHRDFMKLLRDPARFVSSLVFPLLLIAVLGGSLQSSFGGGQNIDLIIFSFTGVLAQSLFMSAANGVISVIADREEDFSQEMFVTPIARHSIVMGKVLGETMVALPQGLVLIAFGLLLGIKLSPRLFALLPVGVATGFLGAAFGVLVLSRLRNQRSANQVFPFLLFPQFFLAGAFSPINNFPASLDFVSHLAPLRYAVDLTRGVFYAGSPEYSKVVLASPLSNLVVMAILFVLFLSAGTWLFVRKERNR